MSEFAVLLVFVAAILHASWNALVKVGGDRLSRLAIVNLVAGGAALVLTPFVGFPDPASWPYLATSILVHQAYYVFLVAAYRDGDLSYVYPIARGLAPLLVATLAYVWAGETISLLGLAAVALTSAGIIALAFTGAGRARGMTALFAILTSFTIAGYTVADGMGVRQSGNALGYIVWLFVLDSLPFGLFAIFLRRQRLVQAFTEQWRGGLLAGILSIGAYGIVIWAMSVIPMTLASAVRETSVVLAALIGVRLLGEPFGRPRLAAAVAVAAGVVVIKLAG